MSENERPIITDSEIVEAFHKANDAAPTGFDYDVRAVIRKVADNLGLERERVRDVMLAQWTGAGG